MIHFKKLNNQDKQFQRLGIMKN